MSGFLSRYRGGATAGIDIDEELLNRCLVLSVDEDREQTPAIHRIQREAQTLEGLVKREARRGILQLHKNAQRLLKPLLHIILLRRNRKLAAAFPDHVKKPAYSKPLKEGTESKQMSARLQTVAVEAVGRRYFLDPVHIRRTTGDLLKGLPPQTLGNLGYG